MQFAVPIAEPRSQAFLPKSLLRKVVGSHSSSKRIRAARVQNEFAPEKFLNRYEKRFEKREKGSEKRPETRLKNV